MIFRSGTAKRKRKKLKQTIKITKENEGKRLDKFLGDLFTDFSRSHLQNLIEKGEVLCNGKVVKTGLCRLKWKLRMLTLT